MRVGVLYQQTGPDGDPAPIFEQIVHADRLGFDSVWIEDRHFEGRAIGSVAIVLAALATRTRAIHLGAFKVLPLDQPARIAEDFAMIDLLAGGRLSFGAAAGNCAEHFRCYGVPFAERAARFREALDIVLAAWTFDEFAYGGQYYQFPSLTPPGSGLTRQRRGTTPYVPQWERGPELPAFLTVTPKPFQRPRPRIWILADEPDLVSFAAERGHSLVLPPGDLQQLETAATAYDAALSRAHRSRSEVELAVVIDVPVDGHGVAARLLEELHRLQDATRLNHIIWRVDPLVPHQELLGAFRHFAAEVQPLLQA